MKRFRVTARDNDQSLLLFNSAEALFAWTVGDGVDNAEVIELNLRQRDFLDVELIGFEYVNDGNDLICLNLIHAAYGRETENESGHTVNQRLCWINNAVFPLREMTSGSLTIRRLADDEGIVLEHPLAGQEE